MIIQVGEIVWVYRHIFVVFFRMRQICRMIQVIQDGKVSPKIMRIETKTGKKTKPKTVTRGESGYVSFPISSLAADPDKETRYYRTNRVTTRKNSEYRWAKSNLEREVPFSKYKTQATQGGSILKNKYFHSPFLPIS
jgi:hypothetical protein